MLIRRTGLFVWAAGVVLLLPAGCTRQPVARPIAQGDVVYFVPTTNKMVALTFDDGPNLAATPRILECLKEQGVIATFFLVGTNVERVAETAQRIRAEGHTIGNHSYSHKNFSEVSPAVIREEIEHGAAAIEKIVGVKPELFRPPYGINGTGTVEYCKANRITIVGWSGDGNDWNPHSPQEIADEIINQAVPGDVILLHDGFETRPMANRLNTIEAVKIVVPRLKEKGFTFVSVPELLRQAGPPVAEFANGIRLLGYDVPAGKPVSQGDAIYVRYFWDVPSALNRKPIAGTVKFETASGFSFEDNHQMPYQDEVRQMPVKKVMVVPPGAPAGDYSCRVGVFDPEQPKGLRRIGLSAAVVTRKNHVVLPISLKVVPAQPKEGKQTNAAGTN
ncbi:MAG: hypothetical protein C0404_00455 [Verrucomicrobia bacterium]|nr:hypothetical protein [Verrucomicrobiota bacterium]